MSTYKANTSLLRISNCLRTILELEPEIARLDCAQSMTEEFRYLRRFLEKIDSIALYEEDMERVEVATAKFLEELEGVFHSLGNTCCCSGQVQ